MTDFKELFLSDPRVAVDKEKGWIWKPVLRAGKWMAGPHGKPLVVVAGHSPDQRKAVGIKDIFDNFNKGIVEHVTIPLSHDDKVDENTGQIRALDIRGDTLYAAHDISEPDIKGKVERGTIPNTSVGLDFDYTHKESGVKYPIVLKHVALTHRPWINKLAPFGLSEEEGKDYEVESFEFSETITPEQEAEAVAAATPDMEDVRGKLDKILAFAGMKVLTTAQNSVMIEDKDGKKFVSDYSMLDDGQVTLAPVDKWVEHNDEVLSTTPPAPTPAPANIPPVPAPGPTPPNTKENDTVTPEEAQALRDQLAAAEANAATEKAERERLQSTVTMLSEKDRKGETKTFIDELRKLGLNEENGCTDFLVYVQNICLSDEGTAAILLSEDGDATPKTMTAFAMLRNMFGKLPTEEKTGTLKIKLSEQQSDPLQVAGRTRPRNLPDEARLSEEDEGFDDAMDETFTAMYGRKPPARATA